MVINNSLLFLILFAFVNCDNDTLVVKTKSGLVKGINLESSVPNLFGFFSIPYAEPPIGDKRFKLPQPIHPWSTTRDATTEGPVCAQIDAYANKDEDCLTLSVYTNDTAELKPVYIFLHGGGLDSGSASNSIYGPDYLMQHDIVVVTIQYRLGILGFLNLGLKDASGNMGLADVIEAIKWIKSNIQYFGGDPNKITLGGISSGGIVVHSLLMSPKSQNLFQKVLIHSGTSLSYRFFIKNIQEPISKTKEVMNMKHATNEEVLAELKKLNVDNVTSIASTIQNAYPSGYAGYYPYSMSKDFNGIIPEDPIKMLRRFDYQQLPMFIGRTSAEGIRLEPQIPQMGFVNNNLQMIVPTDIYPVDEMSTAKEAVAEKIKRFYFGDDDIRAETFTEYAKMCTDSWYGHITDYVVRLQGSRNYSANVYYYMFSVDGAFNVEKLYSNIKSPGATHTDDLGYTWKINGLDAYVPNDDYSELSRERYVALMANFIKYGDPTPETSSLLPIKWEPVNYPEVNYLNINATLTMIGEDINRERLRFWQNIYGYPEL